jgi:hypothetical protein
VTEENEELTMRRGLKWIVIAPLAILGMTLFAFLGGEIVRQLWNRLLPALFGLPQVTFWQALGLLVLCRILFGGFGMRGSSRSDRSDWRRRKAERWERMTPEERERFRRGMLGRLGFGPAPEEGQAATRGAD